MTESTSKEMSEIEFSDKVKKADKWSWIIATAVTMTVFAVGLFATVDVASSAVVAAVAGIGVQFLIPYYAAMSVPEEKRVTLKDHPTADNFNHGAAGSALLTGSLIGTAVMVATGDASLGLWTTLGLAVLAYIPFASRLPAR